MGGRNPLLILAPSVFLRYYPEPINLKKGRRHARPALRWGGVEGYTGDVWAAIYSHTTFHSTGNVTASACHTRQPSLPPAAAAFTALRAFVADSTPARLPLTNIRLPSGGRRRRTQQQRLQHAAPTCRMDCSPDGARACYLLR